jgi:hypothetical protein
MTNQKEKQTTPTEHDTKQTALFIWDLILWVAGTFVLKTSWNLSIRHMFPSLPYMGFVNSMGLLTFVYIVARIASLGFMAEVQRATSLALDFASDALKESALFARGFKIKVEEKDDETTSPDVN